jgi:hypothetical protein
MTEFVLQFPADQVAALAARYSYADDADCQAAGDAARRRGYFTRDEFMTIASWKTGRTRSKLDQNDARTVEETTARAIEATDEAARMEAMLELRGVGVPTASSLLQFAFPDDYPILDVRALESLGQKRRPAYPVSFWVGYLDACRALAREAGVGIRVLDKALWQHSKERSE